MRLHRLPPLLLCLCIAVAPLAAHAGSWKLLDSDLDTTDIGIAFTTNTLGYAAGDDNGQGPVILKTTNGGTHWEACPAKFGIDVLLLDVDAVDNSIVVSSVFGELYSDDGGQSFQPSLGGGQSQSVRYLGPTGDSGEKFGVTGWYGGVNGVGISTDGGKTFKTYNAHVGTQARYGAFPTDTTWYVAAGEWPENNQAKSRVSRKRTEFMNPDGRFPAHYTRPNYDANSGTYKAVIAKTTDGGSTFKTLFNETGTFYFNAIDCSPKSEDRCCAVGEAADSSEAGARIYCTSDGGSTWQRNFFAPATSSSGFSLVEIRYVTDTDIWAVGGELSFISPAAWFLNSADGGKTWTHGQTPVPGYMNMGLTTVSPSVMFTAADNTLTQESGVFAYSA